MGPPDHTRPPHFGRMNSLSFDKKARETYPRSIQRGPRLMSRQPLRHGRQQLSPRLRLRPRAGRDTDAARPRLDKIRNALVEIDIPPNAPSAFVPRSPFGGHARQLRRKSSAPNRTGAVAIKGMSVVTRQLGDGLSSLLQPSPGIPGSSKRTPPAPSSCLVPGTAPPRAAATCPIHRRTGCTCKTPPRSAPYRGSPDP